jgi:hypothetical protein
MGIKREPEVRKPGTAATSRKAAPNPVADAYERNGSAPLHGRGGAGRSSDTGVGSSARKRRKPFVL